MYHYLIIKQIAELLDNDVERLNFLMTCKFSYTVRKSIRFDKFPLSYCCRQREKYNLPNTTTTTTTTTTTEGTPNKKSGFFSNWFSKTVSTPVNRGLSFILPSSPKDPLETLPMKFTRIAINTEEEFRLYINRVKDILDVEEITFYWLPHGQIYSIIPYISPKTTALTIMKSFNQKISKAFFPSHLEYVNLGLIFDKPLEEDVLPQNLKTLVFMDKFNIPIEEGWIPQSVQNLYLSEQYSCKLYAHSFPSNLVRLELGPSYLTKLDPGVLPPSLVWMDMGGYNHAFEAGTLPQSLKTLILPRYSHHKLDHLPSSLTHLDIQNFNYTIQPGHLPLSIKVLYLPPFYNELLHPSSIPDLCVKLNMGREFDQKLVLGSRIFPPFLKELYMGFHFNREIPAGYLPETLEILSFRSGFNTQLYQGSLPNSLKELYLGKNYAQPLNTYVLPEGLVILSLGIKFVDYDNLSLPTSLEHLQIPLDHKSEYSRYSKKKSSKTLQVHYTEGYL
ncbi:hypothetical protein DLAC_01714 [Tieghemostelium lacteum]|uniref:FNIP repeat-containing protein n=1 Tax=Tieghemostelium lacteum TaxID=361077 RepID=A0A152A6H5_TIELA|nr:hypothetical protein DLAC_01714 [Tieghemostelium lacteum]|eukprot:KYR01705.1 hypothetical protein DLAC_01714 [Tieghemostelium lacteum]